jgi:hypothetical protein
MKAEPAVVKALKAIDPKLSVQFVKTARGGRWGVFHDLPYWDRVGKTVERNATELQTELLKRGYVTTRRVCEEYAHQQILDAKLVFYVAEDDGSYRPLDMRVVEKMQRMDYFRRNWDLKDWREYLNAKAQLAKDTREHAWQDHVDYVAKDRVYREQMADALRGDSHSRSVNVTQPDKPARYPIKETRAERSVLVKPSAADVRACS